ncbi:VWA domain-containing protein [Streptomyces sp. NPDC003247]|uniref:VWA domain-containing protein n=1 Tax=Streptomyces sp. NPDC003247 TaxID=3364677 RepID=UPI0036B998AC
MRTETGDGSGGGGSATRPAVLYVGPHIDAATFDASGPAALRHPLWPGLPAPPVIARTPEEVEAHLAAHPGAAVLVHAGDEPPATAPQPDGVLWHLLRARTVLVMCEADGTAPRPVPGPPPAEPAFLLADWPRPEARVRLPRLRHRSREADCLAFAQAQGLHRTEVITGMHQVWRLRALSTARLGPPDVPTVVVHPRLTSPPAGSSDALLWHWLRQGLVLRPWWPPRRHMVLGPHGDLPVLSRRILGDTTPLTAGDEAAPKMRKVGDRLMRRPGSEHEERLQAPPAALEHRSSIGRSAPSPSFDALRIGGSPPRTPPPAPRDTSRPLPHDGLYVRRNNAFGTRSVLGVKELIEQGVIVGQDQIRFDDFLVSRDAGVPGPGPGEALGVSHGLAAVTGGFKANEATTHFVEVALRAGPTPTDPAPAAQPLPVNFVFVVDTSSSMHGEKLDTVRSALHTIYAQLRPADCLGIITFDHRVRTLLPAAPKEELERSGRFTSAVSALYAEGGTDINLGVQYGIDEISRNAVSGRSVNCLYLFSDGDPTSGERDWVRIRTNIAAKIRGDLTLSCFGFGSDARMPELAALAGLAGGHSAFVTRPEQVRADLLGDLNRRDHLAAIDLQLRLDIDPAVEIRHVYAHDPVTDPRERAAVFQEARQAADRARSDYGAEALPDIITGEKGIRIFAPDLAFDETYWVVLEVRVPADRETASLGRATVQYVDTLARQGRRHEIDLALDATLAPETVLVHGVGLWTSEVTFHALDDLYEHDREAAKARLQGHLRALDAAYSHLPAPEFRDDKVTLRKFMSLADSLGSTIAFTDSAMGGTAPAVQVMNAFGRVRSGHRARH